MELKPENEEKEVKYPSEENVDKEKLKKPLKKWQKVGIISIALVIICAIFWNCFLFFTTCTPHEVNYEIINTFGVDRFNEEFISFVGNNIKGITIKSLLRNIEGLNGCGMYQITVNNSNEIINIISSIDSEKFYKVKEEYGADGRINNMNITEIIEEKIEKPQNVEMLENE